MNKRRRYLAKRRRADQRWADRLWQRLIHRFGFCPKCGNHPMNPLPTCPRCGWTGDPDRAGEECDVVFDNATRRPIPPAGRLTGDRSDMGSWIRRHFCDYQPAPWQVGLMQDILESRRRLGVDWANGRDRWLVRYQDGTIEELAPGLTAEQWAAVEARARARSTFGQEPGYPVARAEADQEADHIEKPDVDPD